MRGEGHGDFAAGPRRCLTRISPVPSPPDPPGADARAGCRAYVHAGTRPPKHSAASPDIVVDARMSQDVTTAIPAPYAAARRLEVLTSEETHDLLRLLHLIAGEGLDELSQEAEWFAREIAARIPSEN
ncbi:DUF6417 family protein [Streptomyces sp. NPDC056637]|uniref:DUF6417 family protein n=2 Tax=unclassified Streptomyces TaxID=2593676 RepID=UPI003683EA83